MVAEHIRWVVLEMSEQQKGYSNELKYWAWYARVVYGMGRFYNSSLENTCAPCSVRVTCDDDS